MFYFSVLEKIILNSLSREHIKILGKVFKVMDTDKDGKVTYLEFKAGLSIFRTQLPEEQFLIISDAVGSPNSHT